MAGTPTTGEDMLSVTRASGAHRAREDSTALILRYETEAERNRALEALARLREMHATPDGRLTGLSGAVLFFPDELTREKFLESVKEAIPTMREYAVVRD